MDGPDDDVGGFGLAEEELPWMVPPDDPAPAPYEFTNQLRSGGTWRDKGSIRAAVVVNMRAAQEMVRVRVSTKKRVRFCCARGGCSWQVNANVAQAKGALPVRWVIGTSLCLKHTCRGGGAPRKRALNTSDLRAVAPMIDDYVPAEGGKNVKQLRTMLGQQGVEMKSGQAQRIVKGMAPLCLPPMYPTPPPQTRRMTG